MIFNLFIETGGEFLPDLWKPAPAGSQFTRMKSSCSSCKFITCCGYGQIWVKAPINSGFTRMNAACKNCNHANCCKYGTL